MDTSLFCLICFKRKYVDHLCPAPFWGFVGNPTPLNRTGGVSAFSIVATRESDTNRERVW